MRRDRVGDGYGAGVVDRLVDGAGNGGQPDLLARVRVYQPLYETGAARRMLADRRHDRNHPGDAGADVVLLRAAGRQVVRAALERLAVAGFSVDLRTAAGHPVPDAEILRRARDALQIRVDRLVRSPAKLLLHAGVDGGLVLNAVLRDDGPGSGRCLATNQAKPCVVRTRRAEFAPGTGSGGDQLQTVGCV